MECLVRTLGVDPAEVSGFLHGRRAADAVDHFLPHMIAGQRVSEVDWAETCEMEDTEGVVEVPGSTAFLAALPADRWAIVTSAARHLALCRIGAAGLPLPTTFIAAEDVTTRKPDPSGYLNAEAFLDKQATECLVFEDALAGIRAGVASGADILVVGKEPATHGFSVATPIADFSGLVCEQASDGALRLGNRQVAFK